jgi:hypothetical protein
MSAWSAVILLGYTFGACAELAHPRPHEQHDRLQQQIADDDNARSGTDRLSALNNLDAG